MTRRVFAAMTIAAIGLAIVATAAWARPQTAACTAGVHPFGGTSARTFCGPAKATLVVSGVTIRFAGGSCERGAQYVALNIGTIVLGTTTKPKPEYFGLLVGKTALTGGTPAAHDGTFTAQAVSAHHANKGYAILSSRVKLTDNRARGTFTGRMLGGGNVHGSFRC